MSKTKSKQILRFSIRDRLEHWVLVFSFSLLALTGLVQKFSDASASISIIAFLGGIETVRLIHRFAAIIMMLEVVYHLGVVSYRLLVQHSRLSLLPTSQDLRDALHYLQYNLGLKKSAPRFGRYSFEEKFEYWAVVWGLAIMILTGFMLLNPIATAKFLPGQFIPAAKSAHGNEALLAVIAIIIWHFYNVHVRHFNKSMFSGYLSREEMLEFHPQELAEIEAGVATLRGRESEIAKRRRIFVPVYAVVSALMLLGIFLFVTFEHSALDTVDPAEHVVIYAPLKPTPTLTPQIEPGQLPETDSQGNLPLEKMWPSSAHTNKDADSFRHWDDEGQVDAACSTCHSSDGLPYYLATGSTMAQSISDGLFCNACHNAETGFTIYDVSSVAFPSGASIASRDGSTNLCMTCHKGIASGASLDDALAGLENDVIDESLQFVDIHLAAPAATFFGAEAVGAYQYEGNTYAGLRTHVRDFNGCTDCHSAHQLDVSIEGCKVCHTSVESSQDLNNIRFSMVDYDGDGNIIEGIAGEIATLRELLYVAIQEYASMTAGEDIVYDSQVAPYFFIDSNGNGTPDPGETDYINRYTSWTPRLLKAAYNYHYAVKDFGGFAHNPMYIIQILFDSLESLGANDPSFTRP